LTRRTLAALAEQISERRAFPGALLLTGASEAQLAREAARLAAALLCPGDDPDRRCESCRRVFEGIHPDFLLTAPEGVQIRVDRVRDAIAFAAGRPYESSRRVAVVPRAELLGAEAGNALLKSLEEPGALFHWILTTSRPEMLLPTIRSRCAVARVDPPSAAERLAAWQAQGFRDEDAPDLTRFSRETEEPPTADGLVEYREFREQALSALEAGFSRGGIAPLLHLADALSKAEPRRAQMLSELLADAAASGSVSPELARHPPVAGVVARIARNLPREALARAALRAADPPPDVRRGNRRLHFESVLLELYLARRGSAGASGL
jgi:DNA polymerase-3 subunit delta'